MVSVPGASDYYHGGTLTYSLKSRLKLSGWNEQDIESYTGPSEQVAVRLARNLKLELGVNYSLSETGWTGPSGTEVGRVFFGIVGPKSTVSTTRTVAEEGLDRAQNMVRFARLALEFLLEYLEDRHVTRS